MFVKHTDLGISEQISKHLWIVATENKKGKVGGGVGVGGARAEGGLQSGQILKPIMILK